MRLLASRRWRIFLTAWILFSAHFATNVVREHYPAFTLAEHGTFRVDEYQGFHSDIFRHSDGHSYICNNVAVSVIAAVPLFVFDPVLDALQDYRLAQLEGGPPPPDAEYRTDKPMRVEFFRKVRERGLDLRFGAATAITSILVMAPLSALSVVLMYVVLVRRRVDTGRATWLALLFGLGTPVFFRTANLTHNMFLMYASFLAFVLLWMRPGQDPPVPLRRRLGAGFLGGFCLAVDYMGVVLLIPLWIYLLMSRLPTARFGVAFRESLAYVAGSVPPVLFLLYSQWAMFGNPLLPAQAWMPHQNEFVAEGWRGFDWPSWELFRDNLFSEWYGMYAFGPLLLLGLVPVWGYAREKLILPRRERWFVIAVWVVVLLFCASNRFSYLQAATGFRYLAPLVPLVFLALCDHLVRWPRAAIVAVSVPVILHSWVLTVFREPVGRSWRMFLDEGIVLPWIRVLRMTSPPGSPVQHPLLPIVLLGGCLAVVALMWWYGGRLAARRRPV